MLLLCSGVITTPFDREEFIQVLWDKTMEAFEDHHRILYSIRTLTGRMCNSLKASVELENFGLPRMTFAAKFWIHTMYIDKA